LKKLHLILDVKMNPDELRSSNVASYRLRLAYLYEAARSLGYDVSVGDYVLEDADLYVLGKITIAVGQDKLDEIIEKLDTSKKLIVDYTDDWLTAPGCETYSFYSKVAERASIFVTPVEKLSQILMLNGCQAATVFDGIDAYKSHSPTQLKNKKREVLWFGHSSNIQSLIRVLRGCLNQYDFNLTLVTNKQSFDILRTTNFKTTPKCKVKGVLWTIDSLLVEAIKADFCILPVDKEFASQNRLVTAFRLGLPVLAENISSYEPYGDCYALMSFGAVKEMFNNPEAWHAKVIEAQHRINKELDADVLIEQWATILKNL